MCRAPPSPGNPQQLQQDLGCSQGHCIDPARLFSYPRCPSAPLHQTREDSVFASPGLFSYNLTLKQRQERCCHCHYKLYLLIIHKSKRKRESEGSRSTPFSPGAAGALRAMLSGVMGTSPQPQPRSHRDPGEPWPSELNTVTGVIAQINHQPVTMENDS